MEQSGKDNNPGFQFFHTLKVGREETRSHIYTSSGLISVCLDPVQGGNFAGYGLSKKV